MRYIFFGTPEFAAIILKRLVDADMAPAAVVTNPDRPVGRKKVVHPPAVKHYLLKGNDNSIAIIQPERLDRAPSNEIKKIGAEVGILAAYGKIIPQEVIALFPKGIVVVHPSLLPLYRGPTPIQSALLQGDAETGTTLFLMDEKIDHGKILAQHTAHITYDDTYITLMKKLAEASADLIIETLPRYLRGEIQSQAQDEARASYTKKLTSADGYVHEASLRAAMSGEAILEAQRIWRMVCALSSEPGVWTIKNGRRMKIFEADVLDGKLILKKIQFAGEKPKNIKK